MKNNQITSFVIILAVICSLLISVCSARNNQSYEYENQIQEQMREIPSTNLNQLNEEEQNLNRKPRNMIITYEFIDFDQDEKFRRMIKDALDTIVKFFHDLIMIIPKDRKYSRYDYNEYGSRIEPLCFKAKLTPKQMEEERDTDLHVYVTSYTNTDDYIAAKATQCKQVHQLGPTHGTIHINKHNVNVENKNDGHEVYHSVKILTHEMLHILGFSTSQMISYWVDSNKQKYQDHYVVKTWRGQEQVFLRTPHLLSFAKEYFECDDIPGVPVQNQMNYRQDKYLPGSHWDYFPLNNEIMTPTVIPTLPLFTNFTASLLRDTGYYYSINETMVDNTTFGKGAGCDFFNGFCSYKKFSEYCSAKDNDLCDFNHYGRSFCSETDKLCSIAQVQSEYQCFNEKSSGNSIEERSKYGTQFGVGTKCFNSNLIRHEFSSGDNGERVKGQCYQFRCNEINQVSITIGNQTVICNKNFEYLRVPGFSGYLQCPQNLENFCSLKKSCSKACLGRGYCLDGQCQCANNWEGPTCAQRNPKNPPIY